MRAIEKSREQKLSAEMKMSSTKKKKKNLKKTNLMKASVELLLFKDDLLRLVTRNPSFINAAYILLSLCSRSIQCVSLESPVLLQILKL